MNNVSSVLSQAKASSEQDTDNYLNYKGEELNGYNYISWKFNNIKRIYK